MFFTLFFENLVFFKKNKKKVDYIFQMKINKVILATVDNTIHVQSRHSNHTTRVHPTVVDMIQCIPSPASQQASEQTSMHTGWCSKTKGGKTHTSWRRVAFCLAQIAV